VRTRPSEPTDDELLAAVEHHWSIRGSTLTHQPVGFGSHHWTVDAVDGTRWWVTVDDLANHVATEAESHDDGFARLEAAIATAADLAASGFDHVVAPRRSDDGALLVRLSQGQAVAVQPFVEGRTLDFGAVVDDDLLAAVVDVLAALHRTPRTSVPTARVDGVDIDNREELGRAGPAPSAPAIDEVGPYAAPVAELVAEHRGVLDAATDRLDALFEGSDRPDRLVVTHGEPHPGNVIDDGRRLLLVDWDTVRLGPPERDLFTLVAGDAYRLPADSSAAARTRRRDELMARYEAATGIEIDPSLLDGYALRWDLADAAVYLHQFRRPHTGTADDDQAWTNLQRLLCRLAEAAPGW